MIEAPSKVRLKEITIVRVEGMRNECISHTVHSWLDADTLLNKMAASAPKPGTGIHNVDYHVEFEDGETCNGTYALDQDDKYYACLNGHVKKTIEYHAGLWKPSWMSTEQYEDYNPKHEQEKAKEFLAKYSL